MADRQSRTDSGVVQPVTPGFAERIADLAVIAGFAAPAILLALMTWKPYAAKSA